MEVSEREGSRTLNQWLKRLLDKKINGSLQEGMRIANRAIG